MPAVTLKKIYITRKGLEKLKSEYQYLTGPARIQTARRIKDAREDGEVEENLEYKAALQERDLLENRVMELDLLLKCAVMVEKRRSTKVEIGSTVFVETEGERFDLTLVGSEEIDPSHGLISYESLVGSALLGTKPGDTVTVSCSIKTTYKIIAIK